MNTFAEILQEIVLRIWAASAFQIGKSQPEYSSRRNLTEYICEVAANFFIEPEYDPTYGWNF